LSIINTFLGKGYGGNRMKVVRAEYDFAVNGGLVSTIPLIGQTVFPSGCTIVAGFVDVVTQCTGASATIALQVEAANDILTAVGIASWTTGRKNVLPAPTSGALTASTAVRTTAVRDISMVIAVAALTAGKFEVVLYYIDPMN
jgi:hypothetical protein